MGLLEKMQDSIKKKTSSNTDPKLDTEALKKLPIDTGQTMDAIPILNSTQEYTTVPIEEELKPIPLESTAKMEALDESIDLGDLDSQEELLQPFTEELPVYESSPKQEVLLETQTSGTIKIKETQSSAEVLQEKIPTEENQKQIPIQKIQENPIQEDGAKEKLVSKPKYSLQLKMMGVISLLIAITLSTIIALATYFYKNDSKLSIEESNIETVRIVNSKVTTDILSQIDKAKQLALVLKQGFKNPTQKSFYIDQYFKNDKSLIFLGVYEKSNSSLKSVDTLYNKEFLKKVSITEEDVNAIIKTNQAQFLKSFDGIPSMLNTSPGFQEASICISVPAEEGETSQFVLVILVKLERILDAFKKGPARTTFMVNGEGNVIAHSDINFVLSGKNLMSIPIVRSMLTSQVGNGLERYKDLDGKYYIGSFQKLGFSNAGIITTVEESKAFQRVYNLQERNIYIMIISICVSMILVYLFAKTISVPVMKLLEETIKISKGIFQLEIKRSTNDEVGVLTDYFKNMAIGLEEREKVKSMLGSMIDPVVVAEGMKDLAALKRGDEKTITAFFSDVAGFSSISEQLNSVQLASLLNEYLSAMTIILKKHEGVLDKYIGDAIVGIFGAPVDIGEHYLKAAKASIEMIAKLKELKEYWVKNNLYTKDAQEMDVRIGLNTGPAKVGFMGTDAMGSYTMMGDTVNLAARLEAAGKDYGVNILISEMVKTKIDSEMFTRELDLVRVKGKNEPVRLYELISSISDVPANIKEATELYEKAFKLYLEREWTKSISHLKEAQKAKGYKDKASKLLIERCESYIENPPDKTWDGVFTRTHK